MPLEIYVPNTGQGDCTFIVFPNGKNMLIDFNKTSEDIDIIDFLKDKITLKKHDDIDKTCRRINYFVNTHPHDDHIKGIGQLNCGDFYIDEIWESNHRLYVPKEEKDNYKNYYDFLDLVNKLKKRNSVKKLRAGRAVFANIGTCKVYVFGPSSYLVDSKSRDDIHKQSGIIKVEYDNRSILFAGDSNRDNWEERIVPHYSDNKIIDDKKQINLLDSTILHVSHHGSKYFFVNKNNDDDVYNESMDKISPDYSVVSVAKNNNFGHPHSLAIDEYKKKTKYKRVYSTSEDKSMYFEIKTNSAVVCKKDLDYDSLVSANEVKKNDSNDFTSNKPTSAVERKGGNRFG